MTTDMRHHYGRLGETLAAEHLARLGFDILERNFRTRWGELDLIAHGGETIVFCEVKTRRLPCSGGWPLEAIDPRKRAQLRKMAARWLIERTDRPWAKHLRFDAIGIVLDQQGGLVDLNHVESAL